MLPHLVVKVCFCSSLWPQAKLAIGHLLSVVLETSYSHGQYQHATYDCHGNKGDDCPAGALGNPGYLRETPCICPLGEKNNKKQESSQLRLSYPRESALAAGTQRSLISFSQHICFCLT